MTVTKPLTTAEKKDLALNQVIKPKLQKFVIDEQFKKAAETSKKEAEERKEMLKSEDIILRAEQLSKKAFLELKLWKTIPPTLQMKWLTASEWNESMIKEQNIDISGFAFYLVREYRNYLKLKHMVRGYRNPMDDTHLEYFWTKCQGDLQLLIKADMTRKQAGNAGIILAN